MQAKSCFTASHCCTAVLGSPTLKRSLMGRAVYAMQLSPWLPGGVDNVMSSPKITNFALPMHSQPRCRIPTPCIAECSHSFLANCRCYSLSKVVVCSGSWHPFHTFAFAASLSHCLGLKGLSKKILCHSFPNGSGKQWTSPRRCVQVWTERWTSELEGTGELPIP